VYCNCKIITTLAQDLGFKVSFLLMLDTLFECYIGVCVCVLLHPMVLLGSFLLWMSTGSAVLHADFR